MGDFDIDSYVYEFKLEDDIHQVYVIKTYSHWSKKYTVVVSLVNTVTDKVCLQSSYYSSDIKDQIFQKNELGYIKFFPRIKIIGAGTHKKPEVHISRKETREIADWIVEVSKPIEEMRDDFIDNLLN